VRVSLEGMKRHFQKLGVQNLLPLGGRPKVFVEVRARPRRELLRAACLAETTLVDLLRRRSDTGLVSI